MQRAKNEEAARKAQQDFIDNDKRHWRALTLAEEEVDWEKKLRIEAHELLAFLSIERQIEEKFAQTPAGTEGRRTTVKQDTPEQDAKAYTTTTGYSAEEALMDTDDVLEESTTEVSNTSNTTTATESSLRRNEQSPQNTEPEPETESEPMQLQQPSNTHNVIQTPRKQFTKIPMKFNDDDDNENEDKENHTPQQQQKESSQGLKTPLTIDRAAALAAIQYRRGRAKSFMNHQATPRKLALVDPRRDVSAPPLVTMSVGRKMMS